MILVKIKEGNYEGIINLEFVKTMYIDYRNLTDEFIIKAVYGNNDIAIIDKCKKKEEGFKIIRLISQAVEEEAKVIYLNVHDNKFEEGD